MGKAVFILEGASSCTMPDGSVLTAPRFVETTLDIPSPLTPYPLNPLTPSSPRVVIEAIETACAFYLKRQGLSRVVIGASGGVDSALAAAIYARVVGAENVLLATLPSRHNSQTTITLARQLAERLGTYYTEVPIEESVRHTCEQINGLVCERGSAARLAPLSVAGTLALHLNPLAIENIQARDRSGRVLAALASAWRGVFTCNANKSELTVGYGTMYGDMAGFFAVLGDLWKTEVWELADCYNKEIFGAEIIPQGSIDIVPSAELSAEQNVDEGKGDPLDYPRHDKLFASWTEDISPATLEGGDADTEKMWRLFKGLARAKRLQAPPILSLKNRTYGFDLR
jgi:NAD+ synthase (glutamine-hydrolysing)